MYANFGAAVAGNIVTLRLFFPDAGIDPTQYRRGSDPRILTIRVGGTFQSISPGEDTRFLLASLVVVIIGGMGSIPGAALGALIIGLAEQLGSVYIPTYAIVVTFLIMVLVLAIRPQGLLAGR